MLVTGEGHGPWTIRHIRENGHITETPFTQLSRALVSAQVLVGTLMQAVVATWSLAETGSVIEPHRLSVEMGGQRMDGVVASLSADETGVLGQALADAAKLDAGAGKPADVEFKATPRAVGGLTEAAGAFASSLHRVAQHPGAARAFLKSALEHRDTPDDAKAGLATMLAMETQATTSDRPLSLN